MALTFEALSAEQYAAIVPSQSPLMGEYGDLVQAAQDEDVNPRLLLAWLRSENSFATNISADLLAAHNAAGIKFVGQPLAINGEVGVVAPLAPASEGSVPYCVFPNWLAFFHTLARNIRTILPDAWAQGNLAAIASYYTTGDPNAGGGANKVQFFNEYEGGTVSATPSAVYGEDIINYVKTLIGQADATPETDPVNGVHPWAYYCESLAERAPEHLGLPEVRRGTALEKLNACRAQGLLQSGHPEHGAWVLFDASFYFQGHIAFWDEDAGQVLGTVTNGRGIDYTAWNEHTPGYAGWVRVPGVVAPRRPAATAPPPSAPTMNADGTNLSVPSKYGQKLGVGGANKREYVKAPEVFGLPVTNEFDAYVFDGAITGPLVVQVFENLVTIYDKPSDTWAILKPGARIIPTTARSN